MRGGCDGFLKRIRRERGGGEGVEKEELSTEWMRTGCVGDVRLCAVVAVGSSRAVLGGMTVAVETS